MQKRPQLLDNVPTPEAMDAIRLLDRGVRIFASASDTAMMREAGSTPAPRGPEGQEQELTEEAAAALFMLFRAWHKDVFAIWYRTCEYAETGALGVHGDPSPGHTRALAAVQDRNFEEAAASVHKFLGGDLVPDDEACVDALLTLVQPVWEAQGDRMYVVGTLGYHLARCRLDDLLHGAELSPSS